MVSFSHIVSFCKVFILLALVSLQLNAQDVFVKELDSVANSLEQSELDSLEAVETSFIKPIGEPRSIPAEGPDSVRVESKREPASIDSLQTEALKEIVEDQTIGDEKPEGREKLEEIRELISGDNIFYSIVFLVFGYFVIRILSYLLNALAERTPSYRIAFKGAIPIIKIVIWTMIIILIIVVIFKPSITTMLAFSASIGVAVGFASQDILKNIFGGIIILMDRPFVSGDKIEVDKYYGEVIEIGLRSTRIVTPDDSVVTVPNAVMMNSSLSNSNSGELNCQVVAEIFLPNHIDMKKVRSIATEAAATSKHVFLNKPIVVLFFHERNQAGSYIKMKIKAYVMDTRDEFKFKSEMTELTIAELVKEGILE